MFTAIFTILHHHHHLYSGVTMNKHVTQALLIAALVVQPACSKTDTQKQAAAVIQKKAAVHLITSSTEFQSILDSAKDKLLMFDLYADWCGPCRILSPLIEEIAQEQKENVSVYKINVDKSPDIAAAFGVSGIPFVVFVKNKNGVHALTGVQPKEEYVRTIKQFASKSTSAEDISPNGTLIEGKRVIRLSTATTPGNLYVYRGETVSIIIDNVDFPYAIAIPAFNIMQQGVVGKSLEVSFKADSVGVYPMFCNGKCPSGDGSRYGQIVVMQFESKGKASFAELSAVEAAALITSKKPFILDVRTPAEYYGSHLKDAYLLPLNQLEGRLSEIAEHKDSDVLVYCRSGNRSTVAAQILIKNGFTKLNNLRPGIVGWERAGLDVVKE